MQISLMQKVDYFVGIPLCFALSLFESLKQLISSPGKHEKNKRILFIELSEMGSAIIAYSSIEKAVAEVGKENVYFLIFESNKESVEILNLIPNQNILTVNSKSLPDFIRTAIQIILRLRKLQITTALDLELFSRCTALLSYLSGAGTRVGFDNYTEEGLYRGKLHTHRVLYNSLQHMSQNFLALLDAANSDINQTPLLKKKIELPSQELPIYPHQEHNLDRAKALLLEAGYKGGPGTKLFVLNPDPGALELRAWPLSKYCELAERILNVSDKNYVVIVGLPSAQKYYQTIAEHAGSERVLNITGKTRDLKELLALLFYAHCFITNDSGPAHMASLVHCKTITLFGPETPVRYRPLGKKSLSISAELSCSPCFSAANHRKSACNNNICMQAISVDEVWNGMLELNNAA